MQLNLFEDNRPIILRNFADDLIGSKEFARAVAVYDQLIEEYPADTQASGLRDLIDQWGELLSEMGTESEVDRLHSVWLRLDSLSLPALRRTALEMLVEAMQRVPGAEMIYRAPRFCLGQVLMEAGRFAEAAECFLLASSEAGFERGRFLAWQGDALTLAGKKGAALKSYLAAFTDDPFSIEMSTVKHQTILDLHLSLRLEAGDEIEEDDEPAWLPVWGWLNDVFPLPSPPAQEEAHPGAEAFEALLAQEDCRLPRVWLDMLALAERLRKFSGGTKELGAVRRLMKKSSGFMFGRYLEKIS